MTHQTPKKVATISLDLPPALLERTKTVAEQNGRTVAAEIRFAMKRSNQNPITLAQEEAAEYSPAPSSFVLDELRPGWDKNPNYLRQEFSRYKALLAKYGVPPSEFDGVVGDLLVELHNALISE